MRVVLPAVSLLALLAVGVTTAAQTAPLGEKPHLLQRPALSQTQIVFNYAGDLWSVDRKGGRAVRITVGVGIETSPVFSPDGGTIAFTGEYDGNMDVFTIPAAGGVPHRVTYHPSADAAVGWSPDSRKILFRSDRESTSRYTQLYEVPAEGGLAKALPLPMAFQGQISGDGASIAYSPLGPSFSFDYNRYVAWGNYRGGRASTIWVTGLKDLNSTEIPHETASDIDPVWVGKMVYFLSDRNGSMTLYKYDPATKAVTECLKGAGKPDIHSLAAGPGGLVYDELGEIYLYDTSSGESHRVPIDVTGDLPEVRPRIQNVSTEIDHVGISPSGLRAVFEAHGEILTVPVKKGPTRDITNTPGVMERSPAWSPDGQSIAYFSDESGLYAVHIANQTGSGTVKKFPLAKEAAYYFDPVWSPDSKLLAFHDNRLNLWMLDTITGKVTHVGENDFFATNSRDIAWSPDSKWIAYSQIVSNHLHALFLYSVETNKATQFTANSADSRFPTFDRNGKYLYFTASTNSGGSSAGLDMTSDLLYPNRSVYALVLASDQASPIAPESDDEKTPAETHEKAKENTDATPAGEATEAKEEEKGKTTAKAPTPPKPVKIDLANIESRIVALPLPAANYESLTAGKPGTLYLLQTSEGNRFADRTAVLNRFVFDTRKTEKLAEHVDSFDLSADGEKMLLGLLPDGGESAGGGHDHPSYVILPANVPVKAGEGSVSLADLQIRIDPAAEWNQMYHEVWRVERAYFYDPNFHGVDTVAEEKRFEPYVQSIAARSDLNYIFQEMLSGFSVGHLRGTGGAIPEAKKVPGGLLGADYIIANGHYCVAKIYTGGSWNPEVKAPLAEPGLNVHVGDCILSIGGQELKAEDDIQRLLEGTAGHAITLRLAPAGGANARDITVVPIRSEASLRNSEWIQDNQRKVDQLSGGKLAYVYLPDTGAGGFTNFNRFYFSQLDKQGAVIDERFNAGGQVADYIIEAMQRKVVGYWAQRYGAVQKTTNASISGPKVMIINEVAGSGGDAMPWLFHQEKVGTLVGKRTWGGLVGIGAIPVLMDGGNVTSPSFGYFSPEGKWQIENHGTDPDVVIEQDPKAVREGHDPQLEKAVSLAMQDLALHPIQEPAQPPYPNYHKK
ncbi:S41 family peptidase [Granulicella sp. S190]|uniref:S41 family peptidase n=1 Tax=Granulicella sp. S190 TaxID=1747226 RepID=UPI00131D92BC|nr:S41 family peptidase [Granulicella sp. S190]